MSHTNFNFHQDLRFIQPFRRVKTCTNNVVIVYDKDIKYLLTHRVIRRKGISTYNEYLVKWRNLFKTETTLECKKD